MTYRISDTPLTFKRGVFQLDLTRMHWYAARTQQRWEARRTTQLEARRMALRAANRRFRRTNGLSLVGA